MMTREEKRNELYDFMIDNLIATEDELSLVAHLMGFSLETMEAVLWERTGYNSLEQYLELEEDE